MDRVDGGNVGLPREWRRYNADYGRPRTTSRLLHVLCLRNRSSMVQKGLQIPSLGCRLQDSILRSFYVQKSQ